MRSQGAAVSVAVPPLSAVAFFSFHSVHARCVQTPRAFCVTMPLLKMKFLQPGVISPSTTLFISAARSGAVLTALAKPSRPHRDRVGELSFLSPFLLASLLSLLIRLLSLSVPVCSLTTLRTFSELCCLFFLCSLLPLPSFPLLPASLSWVSARPTCSLHSSTCCLPAGDPGSGPKCSHPPRSSPMGTWWSRLRGT